MSEKSLQKKLLHKIFPLLFLAVLFCSLFCGCQQKVDYFDYVSELRSNIFLARSENLSLRIFAVKKEYPYLADGIPEKSSYRLEAYMVAPNGNETVRITLQIGDKTVEGEMSFDNVKQEYFYSCTADCSTFSSLPCTVRYGEQEEIFTATSVLTSDALSPQTALTKLTDAEPELFKGLTDKYGFAGEIYLRLLYEEAPYYYIGVIDRAGKITAFLMNAQTGKLLATRK